MVDTLGVHCVAALNVSALGSVKVVEGYDAVLSCNVTGSKGTLVPPCSDDVQLEWLVNGSTIASCLDGSLENYSREITFDPGTGSLTVHAIRTTDAANFTCAANDRFSGFEYDTTELIVKREKFRVETSVVQTAYIGGNVSLQCSVLAESPLYNRQFKFQWSRGNVKLSDNMCKGIEGSSEKAKYEYHYDNLSCNLTVLNVEKNETGNYTCRVNDTFYEQTNSTQLNVTEIVTTEEPRSETISTYVETTSIISTLSTASLFTGSTPPTAKGATTSTEPPVETSTSPALTIVSVLLLVLLCFISILLLVWYYLIRTKDGHAQNNQYVVHFRRNSNLTPDEQQALTAPERSEIVIGESNLYEENHTMVRHVTSAPTAPPSANTNLNVKVQHTTRDGVQCAQVTLQDKEGTWYNPAKANKGAGAQPKRIARSQEELIYIDIQHLREHPRNAPPIRTEPPTEYAEIMHITASGSTSTGLYGLGAKGGHELPVW
ncbi:uncharacterized protein LOC117301704 [Asterias rubens]|uniref:uncharacterized protein LOC117301704 n=1 Tax=Asterias rubens TaxID=7604 RepID=UPI0014557C5E|nr:uncharacterized protein LOC117301704 [Asterias rubens]